MFGVNSPWFVSYTCTSSQSVVRFGDSDGPQQGQTDVVQPERPCDDHHLLSLRGQVRLMAYDSISVLTLRDSPGFQDEKNTANCQVSTPVGGGLHPFGVSAHFTFHKK